MSERLKKHGVLNVRIFTRLATQQTLVTLLATQQTLGVFVLHPPLYLMDQLVWQTQAFYPGNLSIPEKM